MPPDVFDALAAQHAELDGILGSLDDEQWSIPAPRCPGWTVADVVLHLAQSDEMGIASATGEFENLAALFTGSNVDEGAAGAVESQRGVSPSELLARWRAASSGVRDTLAAADPKVRLPWVTNTLAPATLATTRLAEAWIHTGDVADAVGIALPEPADRLRHIAWLAWRTLPYAFERDGKQLSGPVAVTLTMPDGPPLEFGDPASVTSSVTGPLEDWCSVAARRVEPSATQLRAEGPDADDVLALVRTYA